MFAGMTTAAVAWPDLTIWIACWRDFTYTGWTVENRRLM